MRTVRNTLAFIAGVLVVALFALPAFAQVISPPQIQKEPTVTEVINRTAFIFKFTLCQDAPSKGSAYLFISKAGDYVAFPEDLYGDKTLADVVSAVTKRGDLKGPFYLNKTCGAKADALKTTGLSTHLWGETSPKGITPAVLARTTDARPAPDLRVCQTKLDQISAEHYTLASFVVEHYKAAHPKEYAEAQRAP